jgi:hypothetical protein
MSHNVNIFDDDRIRKFNEARAAEDQNIVRELAAQYRGTVVEPELVDAKPLDFDALFDDDPRPVAQPVIEGRIVANDAVDTASFTVAVMPTEPKAAIDHGVYVPTDALLMMNRNLAVIEYTTETLIARRTKSGDVALTSIKDMRQKLSATKVRLGESQTKPIFDWWFANVDRTRGREAIFDPAKPPGATGALDEFNFWQGFGVQPIAGTDKIERMLDHIDQVICRGDKVKRVYLIRWMAWKVQNPEKHPGVCVVLKSEREGTGKSTVGETMRRLFGKHGYMAEKPDQILGNFNNHLEHVCFVLLEETALVGDRRTADGIKARLTASTVTIEPKFRERRTVPNMMAAMLCTNHDWAVDAGNGARRWFVIDVSEERARDRAYFDALYSDLESGGYGQFLKYLQQFPLDRRWHARNPPQTAELVEQQLMSLSPVNEWLWHCADEDRIVGGDGGLSLGRDVPTEALYRAFIDWAAEHRRRSEKQIAFGRALAKALGAVRRCPQTPDGRRPWGYVVPESNALRSQIQKAIGVRLA